MISLFKTVALLVAAFIFFGSPAFAAKIVGCKMENGVPKKIVSYTADEMSQWFLDHRGPRTMVGDIFLRPNTISGYKDCDEALVATGLKKPEVRVLGTRPTEKQIAALKPGLYNAAYCNNGKVYRLSINVAPKMEYDSPYGGSCIPGKTEAVFVEGL